VQVYRLLNVTMRI